MSLCYLEFILYPLDVPRIFARVLLKLELEEMLPRNNTTWTGTALAPLHWLFLPLTYLHARSFPPSLLLYIQTAFGFRSIGLSTAEPLIMVISW